MIRLAIPSIEDDDLKAVAEVLATGYLVQGRTVAAFEELVASYVGTAYGVAVSNCTAALHLALLALGVGKGDKIAVTTYSWPATANVIVLAGAEPVFVDIEPGTFNMDPDALEKVLARTSVKAVLPVHAFGGMANLPRIMDISNKCGVPVVEDAACALGASIQGKMAGTWGAMGCFSFHPRKAITTGEGGIITTNDPNLARQLRVLRNHGLDPNAASPDFIAVGFNYRLTEFQAAMGCTQMSKLDRLINARRTKASIYTRFLENSQILAPSALDGCNHVFQSYVVLLPTEVRDQRNAIIRSVREQGIEVTIGTYHMPLTTVYRRHGGYRPGDFPVTDDIASRAVSLPMHECLTEEEQREVISALKSAILRHGG